MCLAVPAKIIRTHNTHAEVDMMGVRKHINVLLVDDLHAGDNVMVHAGYAISKIDDEYYTFLESTLRQMLDNTP